MLDLQLVLLLEWKRGRMEPGHLQQLYEVAKRSCKVPEKSQKLARLLTEYSTGDGDVGHTPLVKRKVPVVEGNQPICLPPHRL